MKEEANVPNKKDQTLAEVLYVGPTRAKLLEEAGIRTLDDLRAADAEQIGRVKGVGLRNGERIKEWLAQHDVINSPAPDVAAANQEIADDMTEINDAVLRVQQAVPQDVPHKKLDRQVDKLTAVLSELAEGPDTLRPKQIRRSLKMLRLINALLDTFPQDRPVSEKIVVAFAEELRDRRKRLQEILDPKK